MRITVAVVSVVALALAACGGPSAQQKKACEMYADVAGPAWRTDISDAERDVQVAKVVAARGAALPTPDVEAPKRKYEETHAAISKRVADAGDEYRRLETRFADAMNWAYTKERNVQGPAHAAADVLSKARLDAYAVAERVTAASSGEYSQAAAERDLDVRAAAAARAAYRSERETEEHSVELKTKWASDLKAKHGVAHASVEFRLTMTKREVDEALALCNKKETK
jgi:hypothetical protein